MPASLDRYRVVLASNSPRRKELMAGLGVDHVVKALFDIDGSYPDFLQNEEVPLFIARKRMAACQSVMHPEELLITTDTIVWHEGKAFGKPSGREDAMGMLRNLSGKSHRVTIGIYLTTYEWQKSPVAMTDVRFAALDEDEIIYYIDHYQPMDKIGPYGVQEWIGLVGVKSISDSYFNVVGLPIQRLYRELKQLQEAVSDANFISFDLVWHFPRLSEGGEYHTCLLSWRDQSDNLSCAVVTVPRVDYLFPIFFFSISMLIIVLPRSLIFCVPRSTKGPGQNKIFHRQILSKVDSRTKGVV